jgi:hypothetical protein
VVSFVVFASQVINSHVDREHHYQHDSQHCDDPGFSETGGAR